MQNRQAACRENITLYLDESSAFNRHLLTLIKQWDKEHNIDVRSIKADDPFKTIAKIDVSLKSTGHARDNVLQVIDNNGSTFEGAEAMPIILKHLPFGKLAAAIYILPGTMWVTKQLYSLPFTH